MPEPEENTYKVVLTREEALIIQRMRRLGYGTMTVHIQGNKPIRLEVTGSELVRDIKAETITIAFEVVK
jgi:hypothetical protein